MRQRSATANKQLERIGQFPRFSGHPELTFRSVECQDQDRGQQRDTAIDSKATAVRLSELPGVEVQDVASSLYIHPFMLSRWRKEAREGQIMTKGMQVEKDVAAELEELRRVKKQYERLKLEHEILKKAIAFTSDRRQKSSSSSKRTSKATRSE
jgi:transposase